MHFTVVIPARYASSRLPGKPLLEIAGKPMIQHVWERVQQSGANRILIATDDVHIQQAANDFGAEVAMTRADHTSGTDRLAEVVDQLQLDTDEIVVNVQGDEPQIPPELIHQVAEDLDRHADASMATLYRKIEMQWELLDPHAVKVVMDHNGYALYFSRAPIPWDRDRFSEKGLTSGNYDACNAPELHFRHIGLYSYRAGFLRRYTNWSACPMEQLEALEQLRVLWQGEKIHLSEAKIFPGHGVDTEADLQRIRNEFTN